MKNILLGILPLFLLLACVKNENSEKKAIGFEGTYHGFSWKGAGKGVTLEEATEKIETSLTLDKNGIITDANMDFLVLEDEEWKSRKNTDAEVSIDYTVDPKPAVLGKSYKDGTSMFDIKTNDKMSFYALGVDADGTVAVAIVDAALRYQFEMKLEPGFDFDTKFEEMTVNNGLIPTLRVSEKGTEKPSSWLEFEGKYLYDIHYWDHIIGSRGVFKGIGGSSPMREVLLALGVEFQDGVPVEMAPIYGFHSNGGWKGNYTAVAEYLKGEDATEKTSLINWSDPRYAPAISANNLFGIDVPTGATKIVQSSTDGIAGATVRFSKENTSYQAALAQAGIISEDEIIIGRF